MILRSIILFILLIDASSLSAQINRLFLDHLYQNGLKRESQRYIQLNAANDSINYFLAGFAIRFSDDSLLEQIILSGKSFLLNDQKLNEQVALRALILNNEARSVWFKNNTADEITTVYRASENPLLYGSDLRMNEYSDAYIKYKQAFKKNALLAAGFSALIPGAGKLYLEKPVSFIGSFVSTNLLIAQSAESVFRLGIRHPFSIFNLAAASVFYLANVYGTYNDCRMMKKLKRKVFLHEAFDFYNTAR